MTEQELNILRLQQAIKVVEMSLATGKNPRTRGRDKETLANLRAELAAAQIESLGAKCENAKESIVEFNKAIDGCDGLENNLTKSEEE